MIRNLKQRIAAFFCTTVTVLTTVPSLPVTASAESVPCVAAIGDAIGSRYMLESGDYCYADYIADYLGAGKPDLLGKKGTTSEELLDQLMNEKSATSIAIGNADVVLVSIGSNDMLNALTDFVKANADEGESFKDYALRVAKSGQKAAEDLTFKLNRALRTPRNTLLENIETINKKIHSINPDTKVVFQKIYNPFELQSPIYNGKDYSEQYQTFIDYVRGHFKQINNGYDELKDCVVADSYTLFRDNAWVYTFQKKEDLHMTALGHAVMAADTLNRLGYTDAVVDKFKDVVDNAKKCTEASYIPVSIREFIFPHAGIKLTHKIGDVDMNGGIKPADASAVLTHYTLFGITGYDPNDPKLADFNLKGEQYYLADANGDGNLNSVDASMILTYATMIISGYELTSFDDM